MSPDPTPTAGRRGRDPDHWSPVRVFAKARTRKGRRPLRRAWAALRGRPHALLAAGAISLLILVGLSAPSQAPLHGFLPDSPSGESAAAVPPTAFAREEIPPLYLSLYLRFGEEMSVDWRILAAIGWTESNHGRDPASRVVNSSGCVGPMQLGVGGACGDFVAAWGTDGNGDGTVDPNNPADAIATAARGLRQGKGAPGPGGTWEEHRTSACRYYGACSADGIDYAERVMGRAVQYGFSA